MKATSSNYISFKSVKKPVDLSWSKVNDNVDIVVIRNLDPSTDLSAISYDLGCLGYKVLSIRVANNCWTKRAVPVFFVKLEKSPRIEEIYDVRYLAHQVILIERYVPNPELPRCRNCQGLDHLMDKCNKPPICAWCSGHHPTKKCYSGKDIPPTCSRCRGNHPSNYKGCQIYRHYLHRTKDMQALADNETVMSKSSKQVKQEPSNTKHQESKPLPKPQKPIINKEISLTPNYSSGGSSLDDYFPIKQDLSQTKHQESILFLKKIWINKKMSLTPNFSPKISSLGVDSTVKQESSETKHEKLKVGQKHQISSINTKMSPTPNFSPEIFSSGNASIKEDEDSSSDTSNSLSQDEQEDDCNPTNSEVTFLQHYSSMNKDLRVMIFKEVSKKIYF